MGNSAKPLIFFRACNFEKAEDARRKASVRINEAFRFGALKNEFASNDSVRFGDLTGLESYKFDANTLSVP